jgi:hypothetical protein
MAGSAQAGAWPRAEGEVFLSLGGNVALIGESARPVHYDPTLYLEYGFSDRITVGLDGFTADRGDAGSLFVFGRYALDIEGASDVWAVGLGVGVTILPNGAQGETVRATLHWGRGLETGWLAVDAEASFGLQRDLTQTKIDATWGYRINDRWTAATQFQIGTGLTGDTYTKVSPSMIWDAGNNIQVRAGLVQALSGDYGTGLSLQSWITF